MLPQGIEPCRQVYKTCMLSGTSWKLHSERFELSSAPNQSGILPLNYECDCVG